MEVLTLKKGNLVIGKWSQWLTHQFNDNGSDFQTIYIFNLETETSDVYTYTSDYDLAPIPEIIIPDFNDSAWGVGDYEKEQQHKRFKRIEDVEGPLVKD